MCFKCARRVKFAIAFIAVDNVFRIHVLVPQRPIEERNKERKRDQRCGENSKISCALVDERVCL